MSVMVETSSAKAERASAGMAARPRQNSRLRIAFLPCVLRERNLDGAEAKSGLGSLKNKQLEARHELLDQLQIRPRQREPGGVAGARRSCGLLSPDGLLRDDGSDLQ